MDAKPTPAEWQLRLLGGAVGAIVSAATALVTAPTLFGFVIGLAGIPIAALIGLCYAPELLAQPAEAPIPGSILGLATFLGTVFTAMLFSVSQSHGASPFEILEFGYLATIGLGLVSLLVGVAVVNLVTHWSVAIGRRLAPRAPILCIPSAVVLVAVGAGTFQVVLFALRVDGDLVVQASRLGQP
jgi:hypothetical protein